MAIEKMTIREPGNYAKAFLASNFAPKPAGTTTAPPGRFGSVKAKSPDGEKASQSDYFGRFVNPNPDFFGSLS